MQKKNGWLRFVSPILSHSFQWWGRSFVLASRKSRLKASHVYIFHIYDWYISWLVDWEVDDIFDTRIVIAALKKAFNVVKPVVPNSDQECQFTNMEYRDFVKKNKIRQSTDGKSWWADYVMIERWFCSLKYEEAYLTQCDNQKAARKTHCQTNPHLQLWTVSFSN